MSDTENTFDSETTRAMMQQEIESQRATIARLEADLHDEMVQYDRLFDEAAKIRAERDELKDAWSDPDSLREQLSIIEDQAHFNRTGDHLGGGR